MTSKIKVLSVVMTAIVALSAMAAATAQAGKLDVGASPAVLTGTSEAGQEILFSVQNTAKTSGASVKCSTASFEGTTQGLVLEEATVTATYGIGKGEFSEAQGCTCGGIKCQVLMNGCKYTLTGVEQAEKTARLDIVGCTSGKQIEINGAVGACALKVGEQNGLSHVVGQQLAAQEATVQGTVTGIKVQQAGGATCPDGASAHTGASGAFTDSTTLKAFQDKELKQVTKHRHQYFEHICGTQVNIQVT